MIYPTIILVLSVTGLVRTAEPSQYIVGGGAVNITDSPYVVALLLDYLGTGVFFHSCGGSIISEKIVISGAQCTNGAQAHQWIIRAGSIHHDHGGKVVPVSKLVEHPDYDRRLNNDIAILFLSDSLSFGPEIDLLNLPYQGQVINEGSLSNATGWGILQEGGPKQNDLHKVTIPIVKQTVCTELYADYNEITENMICAGNLELGNQGTCLGDTGGPLAINKVLVGIISWSKGCAKPNFPSVFTRVPMYREWIDNVINSNK